MVESHLGEGLVAWVPGAEVESAEEPTLLFSAPGRVWFLLSFLLSLPGHAFEEVFFSDG